jgi:hypothetical protein
MNSFLSINLNLMQDKLALSRRQWITSTAAGASALALEPPVARGADSTGPLASKMPHHRAAAKQVIVLYMSGGYSHVDTFDPKPRLTRDHDEPIGLEEKPQAINYPRIERYLKAPLWKFRPNSLCGTEVSDLFPNLRNEMHQIALIRSMHCDHSDHAEATLQLHTGSTGVVMPSLGAWLSYGLGTSNGELPSHMVISEHRPYNGPLLYSANFLPGSHTGVRVLPGEEPLPHLAPRIPREIQDLEFGLLDRMNDHHLSSRGGDSQLRGRAAAFHAARGLMEAAPEALDLNRETASTLRLYGTEPGDAKSYASQCVMARRLIERGVRFVEIIDSVGSCADNWDTAHNDVATHAKYAQRVDQPIAALIRDLDQRGLLDETLLVFCTEFGRTPWAQDGKGTPGRAHHPHAFSCWLAGGGVKRGVVHGQSDEIGDRVATDAVHIHDFHATILHLLGLDHERLIFRHAGRDFRLTDVYGHVVEEILA